MLAYGETAGVILLILSLLATAATLLTQKKPKVASLDDALQSVATQGAFIPLVIGRQRVGPVFAWVEDATAGIESLAPQNRSLTPSSANVLLGTQGNFGKGGGGVPQPPSYYERALHLLCVGPGSGLRAIYQNGELIWSGNIDPLSHPSGSTLPAGDALGSEGFFQIHWGFEDDPILTPLASSADHGLSVRYSHVVKILWLPKNLGQSRQWPRLEYEVVCPCYSQIASTPSEIPLEGDDSKPSFRDLIQPNNIADLFAVNQGAVDGTQRMEFWIGSRSNSFTREFILRERDNAGSQEDLTKWFPSGSIIKLRTSDNLMTTLGGSLPPGTPWPGPGPSPELIHNLTWFLPNNNEWRFYWVIRSYRKIVGGNFQTFITLGPEVDSIQLKNIQTDPPYLPSVDLTSVDFRYGNARPVSILNSDGINPIHMVDQILFAKYPYGCGKDRNQFDTRSIEAAAEVAKAEKIRGGITIRDGEGGKSALSAIFQDMGLFVTWDVQVGKYVFSMVRYAESAVDLPPEIIVEAPEMVSIHGIRPADVLAFTFKDRERNYRDFPVRVDDSGQIQEQDVQRSKKIPIECTNDRDSISRMAPRRQQEAFANLTTLNWKTKNATSQACAGQRFTATATEGAGMQFLITDVKRDINSPIVELGTVIDSYNPPFSNEPIVENRMVTTVANRAEVDQLASFDVFELPKVLSDGGIELLFLASRSTEEAISTQVWGSRDGLQFSILGTCPIVISGVLVDGLPASKCFDEGTYEVDFSTNADANAIMDLSLDPDGWRSGKQIMLIGNELIYLREGAPGHPDTITGLIRGRASTPVQEHGEGTRFYILPASYVVTIRNTMAVAGKDLHYKVQAISRTRASEIQDIEPQTIEVQGLAYTPPPVLAIRQTNLRSDYAIGAASVDLTWNYFSDEFLKTGLGTQPLGAACGQSPPRGYFLVEYGTKKLKIDTNAVSIPLADRSVLDTLPSWDVTITHVEGSFSSTPVSFTLVPA